jgi:hypothetical protein
VHLPWVQAFLPNALPCREVDTGRPQGPSVPLFRRSTVKDEVAEVAVAQISVVGCQQCPGSTAHLSNTKPHALVGVRSVTVPG